MSKKLTDYYKNQNKNLIYLKNGLILERCGTLFKCVLLFETVSHAEVAGIVTRRQHNMHPHGIWLGITEKSVYFPLKNTFIF
jgi:hypothetical protein